jgi:hypothetical protein
LKVLGHLFPRLLYCCLPLALQFVENVEQIQKFGEWHLLILFEVVEAVSVKDKSNLIELLRS